MVKQKNKDENNIREIKREYKAKIKDLNKTIKKLQNRIKELEGLLFGSKEDRDKIKARGEKLDRRRVVMDKFKKMREDMKKEDDEV